MGEAYYIGDVLGVMDRLRQTGARDWENVGKEYSSSSDDEAGAVSGAASARDQLPV